MITLLNLLCGSVAVFYAVRGNFGAVWILCILASVFDFFDGFSARKLGAYSEIGKELDSLSDLVSFGLAPSITLYSWYALNVQAPDWIGWISLAIVAGSALRLAKFNLDERQTKSFLGLPTPACGLLLVSMAACGSNILSTVWFIPAVSVILALLLTSEIPMFSMKQKCGKQKIFFIFSAAALVACIFIHPAKAGFVAHAAEWLASTFLIYIIINLIPDKK